MANNYTTGVISDNQIYGNGWKSGADAQQYDGIHGLLGNFDIYGNTIYNNALGTAQANNTCHGIYALASAVVATIHDNVIYGHDNGNGIKLIGSANVYRNLIYGNHANGIEAGQNGATNVVYQLYQNIVYFNNVHDAASEIVEQTKGGGTLSLTLWNNTVWKNGGTTQQEVKIADNITAFVMKNNILVATDTRRTLNIVTRIGCDYRLQFALEG